MLPFAPKDDKSTGYSTNATSVQGTNDQIFADFLRSGAEEMLTKQITSRLEINGEIGGCPLRAAIKKGQFYMPIYFVSEKTNHFSTSNVSHSPLYLLGNV